MSEGESAGTTTKCGQSETAQQIIRGSFKKAIPEDIRSELSSLQDKDNWHNIIYLGIDWLVIAAAIAATLVTGTNPVVYVVALVLIGSRQRALMNLVHQASHKKLFKNRTANDWVGKLVAAFPILTSLSAYTCAHCRHHGFLWHQQKDPDAARYEALGLVTPPSDRKKFGLLHLLRPMLLLHAAHNVWAALSWDGEPRSETLSRAAFWGIILLGVILLGWTVPFVLFWVVPFLTTFQVFRYWAEMAEHAGLRSNNPWMATRNWTGSIIERELFGPHSDYYHLTHHLFPLIPHYRIHTAHHLLMRVPEYAGAHQCDGFFRPRRPEAPSVLQDIRRPQDIGKFTPWAEIYGTRPNAEQLAATSLRSEESVNGTCC